MSDGNTFLLLVRMVVSLALVLAILVAAARWVSRRQGLVPGRAGLDVTVSVVARQSLTRGAAVHVVRVGAEVLVLGVTDHQVTRLSTLDPDDPALAASTVPGEAASSLRRGSGTGSAASGYVSGDGGPQDHTRFATALAQAIGGRERVGRASAERSSIGQVVSSTVLGQAFAGRGKHRG